MPHRVLMDGTRTSHLGDWAHNFTKARVVAVGTQEYTPFSHKHDTRQTPAGTPDLPTVVPWSHARTHTNQNGVHAPTHALAVVDEPL